MNSKTAKVVLVLGILVLSVVLPAFVWAQAPGGATVSSNVTDVSDAAVADAKVSVWKLAPEAATTAQAVESSSRGSAIASAARATGASVAVAADPAAGLEPTTTEQNLAAGSLPCDVISAPLGCLRDLLHDQAGIWTSPLRIRPHDLVWILPLTGATIVALHYDLSVERGFNTSISPTGVSASNGISLAGSYPLIGAAGAIYAVGKLTHNERARETGMLAIEAIANTGIVSESIKIVTNRVRPNNGTLSSQFWPDPTTPAGARDDDPFTFDGSFPSGHAIDSWAFAHVLVDETPGHPWLHAGFYALAASVSMSRLTGQHHFPSDVIVGSALGYLIGGYVYRQHSQFQSSRAKSLSISPVYNSATRTYAVGVSFTP